MPFPFRQQQIDQGDMDASGAATQAAFGSGTAVSGYVESPTDKKCGTCSYLQDGASCNHETVQKDAELPNDPVNGLKQVEPEDGCCSFWEEGKAAADQPPIGDEDASQGNSQNSGRPQNAMR
jgi:hypothetical protein